MIVMGKNIKPLKSEGELFKKILGDRWLCLHTDIQKRFEKNPIHGTPLYYEGILDELYCSIWGKLLGYITRPLIHGALIPHTAHHFPVHIQVYSKIDCPYIFKERIYFLPDRTPITFTSYMRESEKGEVLEYVGSGLGMKLIVFEKDSNLHFKSDGYFWDIGLFRIPIPDILSPGKTYLTHVNQGHDQFSISIIIKHPVFGIMFKQTGTFHEINKS
jgi:hypothetical protein